jgi:hypothetical protein
MPATFIGEGTYPEAPFILCANGRLKSCHSDFTDLISKIVDYCSYWLDISLLLRAGATHLLKRLAGKSAKCVEPATITRTMMNSGLVEEWRRMELRLAALVAGKLSETDKAAIRHELDLFVRAGILGDVEIAMQADERIEVILVTASGDPKLAAFQSGRREFKNRWAIENRLRIVEKDIMLRQSMIMALIEGNAELAVREINKHHDRLLGLPDA